MGDGSLIEMTFGEVMDDIRAGARDAAERADVPFLSEAEMKHIFEIVTTPGNAVGVRLGDEIVSTSDSGSEKLSAYCMIPIEKSVQALIHERVLGGDSVDIGFADYNYKTVKGVAEREANVLRNAVERAVMPIFYGAMTNLGFYTYPDGPVPNWAELLPQGKIAEALKAQEDAARHAVRDIVYVAERMYEAGADGFNLDTSGAAGDADFLAALRACEEITKRFPGMGVEVGMAGEFVLGMHGKVEYNGTRLAGLYPHEQVKLVEQAGASIFGAVVNTNCNESFAWNIARVCTFIKPCVDAATIPVHANVGMGVGGIPMCQTLPHDVVCKADKILVEICKIDGY